MVVGRVDTLTSLLHLTVHLCLHKSSNSTSPEAILIWKMRTVMVALGAGPSEVGMGLVDAPHEGDFLAAEVVVAPLVVDPPTSVLVGTQSLGMMQSSMKVAQTLSDLHLSRASGLLHQGNLEAHQTSRTWACGNHRLMCGKTPTIEVGAGGAHPEVEVGFLLASVHLHRSGLVMKVPNGVECLLLRSGGEGREMMMPKTCHPVEDALTGSHHATLSLLRKTSRAAHRHPLTGSEKRSPSETENPSSQNLRRVLMLIQSLSRCPNRERSRA